MKEKEIFNALPLLKRNPPKEVWREIEFQILTRQSRRRSLGTFGWGVKLGAGIALLLIGMFAFSWYQNYREEIFVYYALTEAFDAWEQANDLLVDLDEISI